MSFHEVRSEWEMIALGTKFSRSPKDADMPTAKGKQAVFRCNLNNLFRNTSLCKLYFS